MPVTAFIVMIKRAASFDKGDGTYVHTVSFEGGFEEVEADEVKLAFPEIQLRHRDAEGVIFAVTDEVCGG